MPVIYLRGNVAVVWAANVVNVNAPTAAECNGGTRLEGFLTPDGLTVDPASAKEASGNLGTKYDLERFSTIAYDIKLKFHHDTLSDVPWNLFPFKASGFLIVRRGLAKVTTFATSQGNGGPNGTVGVYPLESGLADEVNPDANWDFEVPFALTADPGDRAVVA